MNSEGQARRQRLRQWVKVTALGLFGSLLILIAATGLSVQQGRRLRQATAQEAQINHWMGTLQTIVFSLMEAETAQRGYLLTGNERYLMPYRQSIAALPALLTSLSAIPLTDPAFIGAISGLRAQTRSKLVELAEIIHLYDQHDQKAALALLQTDAGLDYMDRARADLGRALSYLQGAHSALSHEILIGSLKSQRLDLIAVASLTVSVILAALQMGTWWIAQQRYERALTASEQQHRAIVEEQTELIALSKANGTLTYTNPAFRRFFGVSSEALGKSSLLESAAPMDQAALGEQLQGVLKTGAPLQRESFLTGPDGQRKWIAWRHRVQLAPEGEQLIHSVGREITQRKNAERALRDLTDVFEATSDFVAQTDTRGHLQYLNPAARRAVGLAEQAPLTGSHYAEFYTAETNERFLSEIVPAVRAHGVWIGETRVRLAGARVAPVSHMVIAHRDADGEIARYTSIMRDISIELDARQELARQTASLNAIVEEIPAMVAVWDRDLRYRLVNRAFERWRGKSREAFIGRTVAEVAGPAEYERSLPWMKRALAGETVVYEKNYPDAAEIRHVSATYIPWRLPDHTIGGFIGVAQDITRHREEQMRLQGLSEHDPLTGLLNRAGFERYVRERCERGEGALLAVVYIDLDDFKPINDRYGHAVGDEVLKRFAGRLKEIVRPADEVARFGGDEFGVVLSGVRESKHAAAIAEKIVQTAHIPIQTDAAVFSLSASVGVAFSADAEGGWEGLVARADHMVYEAKAAGRGCFRMASDLSYTAQQRSSRPS